MTQKPEMYRGNIKKEFNNNRSIYASYKDSGEVRVYDTSEVRKKINDIFTSNNFIYRTKVNIVIDNKTVTKKVIGVYNNNLVTIDNEHIPINIIQDIYRQY